MPITNVPLCLYLILIPVVCFGYIFCNLIVLAWNPFYYYCPSQFHYFIFWFWKEDNFSFKVIILKNKKEAIYLAWYRENHVTPKNLILRARSSDYMGTLGLSKNGHHQMVNTEIRLIIFFAGKDGEALYSQQKQDQELTVAQIMNSLLPDSDSNWRK